ncbi:hypothetical protein [uncultured Paenibacillus sp.]|uniref:hypothetical protein n=1 Tax=uncultured Paenibacillus sp. TaxID=227322 RepID=UPI0015ADBE0D|nr:hypothetical protein [uncultured Paenibacillus sp.]DAW22615.1 MAG TPA: hypothetical protein [Caudoviricetes sp.]
MKTLNSDIELFAAAITQAHVPVYVGNNREISGEIARFTPASVCVKDAKNPAESAYFLRENCVITAEG